MITPRTQTAIAVLKCIYARDYGTCIKPCTLTEKEKQALLLQLSIAKFILLKDTENPLKYSPTSLPEKLWKYPCWIFSKPRENI